MHIKKHKYHHSVLHTINALGKINTELILSLLNENINVSYKKVLIKNKDNHSISNIKFSSKNRSRENQSKKTLNFLRPRIDQRNPSKKGIKKLLQIAAAFFYCKLRQNFIKKRVSFFITERAGFIAKCGSYYKTRRFNYKTRRLLQNGAVHM